MKPIMNWKLCLKEHIKKIEPNKEKIKSIIKMCDIRLKMLNNADLDNETASVIAADYYEIIKELLVALLIKNGLKSDNHECLISFFKEKFPNLDYETNIIHNLKNVRNRTTYDGVFVKKDYINSNKLEFEHIIKLLKKSLNGG